MDFSHVSSETRFLLFKIEVGPHPRYTTLPKHRVEVGWRGENHFRAIQLGTFWLDFHCFPNSSSNFSNGSANRWFVIPSLPAQLGRYFWTCYVLHLGLLIQFERRFHKPYVLVSPFLAQCRATQNQTRTSTADPAIQLGTF